MFPPDLHCDFKTQYNHYGQSVKHFYHLCDLIVENIDMTFWERLDSEVEKNSSRKEIAIKAGIAANTISMWGARRNFPTADVAVKIAESLGVSVEYLVSGKDASGLPVRVLGIARNLATLSDEDLDDIEALVAAKVARRKAGEANVSRSG